MQGVRREKNRERERERVRERREGGGPAEQNSFGQIKQSLAICA